MWQENWAARRRRLVVELASLPRPAAVFAYNDCVAADVIDACRDCGLRVPEEIAVLGVDDNPYVRDARPCPCRACGTTWMAWPTRAPGFSTG